jgi:hypothetical protein
MAQLKGASLIPAKLHGAALDYAQLQGASLYHAQLQGASLFAAQLQGAELVNARLQGAWLIGAELQGAWLEAAKLQGAFLIGAQLQAASLGWAHLQGATLIAAQLQGAFLDRAQLQGTSLVAARLQGASLASAAIDATDFRSAALWRTNWEKIDNAKIGAVRVKDATWNSRGSGSDQVPWDAKAYTELRSSMNGIPNGKKRKEALKRIEILDCGIPDNTLASCDPAASLPREVLDWQEKLKEPSSVEDTAFEKAHANMLRSLICANDPNAIHILRIMVRSTTVTANRVAFNVDAFLGSLMLTHCIIRCSLTRAPRPPLLWMTS